MSKIVVSTSGFFFEERPLIELGAFIFSPEKNIDYTDLADQDQFSSLKIAAFKEPERLAMYLEFNNIDFVAIDTSLIASLENFRSKSHPDFNLILKGSLTLGGTATNFIVMLNKNLSLSMVREINLMFNPESDSRHTQELSFGFSSEYYSDSDSFAAHS